MPVVTFILVNKQNEILLQKRTADYKFSSKWTLFGGQIEKDELPKSAAIRELKEELNLDIELNYVNRYVHQNEQIYIFSGKFDDLSKISLTEGNGFAFFGLDEIKNMNMFAHKELILKFREWLKLK